MNLNRMFFLAAAPLLALSLTPTLRAQGPPPPGYGWDVAPQELNEVQRQGFHDGIEGARRDVDNHRRPDVENRDEFRHPHVPPEMRDAYRDGFRRGYRRAMEHLMAGGQPGFAPPQPPPPPPQWDAFPNEFNDIQRQGFHDGLEGARRDYENHRPPDVNNRDEYRHPHLPPEAREAYRDGFRRGYDRAMAHLMGRPFRY
ncbi:MAG: hypothetical protein WCC26_11270 [Terracidiphilus sp.]